MSSNPWNPEQYEKFKNERSQPFFDLMDLVLPMPPGHLIDLGCGTGELTQALHKRFRAQTTVGVDSSTEMLKKAQSFEGEWLSFARGDIATWSAEKEYDLVFSNAALQWCEDHPLLFRRMKLALRPRGQIAIQMPMNFDYPTHTLAASMSFEEPWAGLLGEGKYQKQKNMLSIEEYSKLLFDLGFTEQKVFVRVYGHVLDSREGVIEWVKGTLLTHFEGRLSAGAYSNFLNEFRRRLFLVLPDERPFFYPFKRAFTWGRLG